MAGSLPELPKARFRGAEKGMDAASGTSERQAAIEAAAFQAFAAYGYRRTSMDDIAKGAGMSRSALYLHYRNKEDIFRSLTKSYFAEAIAGMEAALCTSGQTPEQALIAAFRAKDGKFMDVVFGTPHGAELLDAGMQISCDLHRKAEAEKTALLTRWLASLSLPPDVGPPETVARTIMAATTGLKFPGQTLDGYRQGQRHLARLIARAISP